MPFRMQNRPSILGRLGGYLLLVGLLGFGCWTMGWHLGEIRDHRASVSWKETQAEILSAQVHFGSKGSVCTCIRYRYQAGSEILDGLLRCLIQPLSRLRNQRRGERGPKQQDE